MKINGGVERNGNDGNSRDCRVLRDLVSFELRQFNRIKRSIVFIDRCGSSYRTISSIHLRKYRR